MNTWVGREVEDDLVDVHVARPGGGERDHIGDVVGCQRFDAAVHAGHDDFHGPCICK